MRSQPECILAPNQAEYLRLEPNGALPNVSKLTPFKAIVVINGECSPEWQDEVSRWLVESGCLYMMAWGPNCSDWDDTVDHAVRVAYPGPETPDDKFVMTTWHADESLEEVFWFAQFCAQFSYNDVELPRALIAHIGQSDRKAEFLELFEQSWTWADRQPDEPNPMRLKEWLRNLFRR